MRKAQTQPDADAVAAVASNPKPPLRFVAMKLTISLCLAIATLSVAQPATAAAPQLSYVTAGHALAYQLLLKGLPVAKRLPDVKCATYVLVRYSPTLLRGRFYADDCKGKGFVVPVAAKMDGKKVIGWAGQPCNTTGPTRKAGGRPDPSCDLTSFPW